MAASLAAPRTRVLAAWWRAKPARERAVLAALALAVAIALSWMGIWEPMQQDLRRLHMERDRTQATLAQARQAVDDINRLQRAALPAPGDARARLEASIAASGLRNAVTDVQWQRDRAQVTFASVDFAAITRWLEALHRDAGIVVHAATLSARVERGSVRAELTLGR